MWNGLFLSPHNGFLLEQTIYYSSVDYSQISQKPWLASVTRICVECLAVFLSDLTVLLVLVASSSYKYVNSKHVSQLYIGVILVQKFAELFLYC